MFLSRERRGKGLRSRRKILQASADATEGKSWARGRCRHVQGPRTCSRWRQPAALLLQGSVQRRGHLRNGWSEPLNCARPQKVAEKVCAFRVAHCTSYLSHAGAAAGVRKMKVLGPCPKLGARQAGRGLSRPPPGLKLGTGCPEAVSDAPARRRHRSGGCACIGAIPYRTEPLRLRGCNFRGNIRSRGADRLRAARRSLPGPPVNVARPYP